MAACAREASVGGVVAAVHCASGPCGLKSEPKFSPEIPPQSSRVSAAFLLLKPLQPKIVCPLAAISSAIVRADALTLRNAAASLAFALTHALP